MLDMKLDLLNRNSIVERILDILNGLRANQQHMVFSLNGKWGSGKTFVLKLLAERIKEENEKCAANERQFCLIKYDCWKYDYYSEPLIALVSAMHDEIIEESKEGNANYVGNELKETAEKLALWGIEAGCGFLRAQTGLDVFKLFSQITKASKGELNEQFLGEAAITKELNNLRKIMEEISSGTMLVIVVDELDRCLPEYMVRIMERLHHLFEGMENIVIIIATDRKQLEHTIKKIYGENADAYAYLQKMIQFELSLDCGVVQDEAVLKKKFAQYVNKFENSTIRAEPTLVEFFEVLFSGIEIRTVIQWIDKINLVHQLSFEEENKLGYDILFYELFWTVFTKVYKLIPVSKEIKISLDDPFGDFLCLYQNRDDWRKLPFIVYLSEKIKSITGKNEFHEEPGNILINENMGTINMVFWYWTRSTKENKQLYSLPIVNDPRERERLKNDSERNLKCLRRFQNIMSTIN